MMRGTGGNKFIGHNPTRGELMASINDQLGDLQEWADDSDRVLDLGELTIETSRSNSGDVSVTVMADLKEKA